MKIVENCYFVLDTAGDIVQSYSTFGPFKNESKANQFIQKDFNQIKSAGFNKGIKYLIVKVKGIKDLK